MNRRGHPKTLVAKHPGNQNALKAGVFSPETLAPRVQEVAAEIAGRRVEEVLTDVLRREVAALAVLGEAMDRSLADDGLNGRGGEPRRMIELRLRLNEKLRRTLDRYEQTLDGPIGAAVSGGGDTKSVEEPSERSLAESIVLWHGLTHEETVTPAEFDPEVFLHAVVVTDDPRTRPPDVIRARRMLTRRRANQPSTCVCISTLRARDEIQLRDWIADLRQSGVEPANRDGQLAAIVRAVARGENRDQLVPYAAYRRTEQAIRDVLQDAAASRREQVAPSDNKGRRRPKDNPAVDRFWRTLLSKDPKVKTKDRLDAFSVLDEMDALPRCTCNPENGRQLAELEADAIRAFIVRMVAQRHYRAAMVIARHPETYIAVRDAIDEATLATLGASDETFDNAVPPPDAG